MEVYNEGCSVLTHSSEIDVMLSLMDERQLLSVKDGIGYLIDSVAYQIPNFPLSFAGLNHLTHHIDYELARRQGKGIVVEGGRSRVCGREESPWVKVDWREKPISLDESKHPLGVESGDGRVIL